MLFYEKTGLLHILHTVPQGYTFQRIKTYSVFILVHSRDCPLQRPFPIGGPSCSTCERVCPAGTTCCPNTKGCGTSCIKIIPGKIAFDLIRSRNTSYRSIVFTLKIRLYKRPPLAKLN